MRGLVGQQLAQPRRAAGEFPGRPLVALQVRRVRTTETIFVDVALANFGFEASPATTAVIVLDGVMQKALNVPRSASAARRAGGTSTRARSARARHAIDFIIKRREGGVTPSPTWTGRPGR